MMLHSRKAVWSRHAQDIIELQVEGLQRFAAAFWLLLSIAVKV